MRAERPHYIPAQALQATILRNANGGWRILIELLWRPSFSVLACPPQEGKAGSLFHSDISQRALRPAGGLFLRSEANGCRLLAVG